MWNSHELFDTFKNLKYSLKIKFLMQQLTRIQFDRTAQNDIVF